MRKTAVLVVLCLSFSVFGFAEKKFPLTGTLVSPAFVGTADVGVDRNNGNARFKIKAELLAPPEKLTPPMAGYLVWFQEPGGNPESQGRIGDDKKQSEELTIHSGSRTITLQSGESWSRTMTAGDFFQRDADRPQQHQGGDEIASASMVQRTCSLFSKMGECTYSQRHGRAQFQISLW